MSTMDVSLRLRLINQLSKPAKEARKEIDALAGAAKKAGGRGAGADGLARAFEKAARAANRTQQDVRAMSGALTTSWAPAVAGARSYSVALDKVRLNADKLARTSGRVRKTLPLPAPSRAPKPSPRPVAPATAAGATAAASPTAVAGGAAAARLAGLSGAAVGAGLSLAGVGMAAQAATRKSLSLERVMYDVEKATDASGASLKRIETFLNDTSRASGKTAEELGQMYAAGGYAGRPVHELEAFTKYGAMATNAWNMQAEEVGQALAELGNIYEARQERIQEIGDAINTMADKSASKESDLLDFLRRTGGSARIQKISAEETLAFGAALKEVGVRTEVASTGFQAMLTNIAMGDEATKSFSEGMDALGMKTKKLQDAFRKSPVEAILNLLERVNKVKDGLKRQEILTNLFGKEYSDDIARMAGATGRLRELLAVARDKNAYLGSVKKSFELMSEKDFNRLERAQAAIDQMSRTIGGPLKEAAGSFAEEFNKIADRIAKGAGLLDRWRAERDAYDDASGRKLGDEAPKPQGKTLSDKLDDVFFGEEGKRDEQIRQAQRAGWQKAADERRGNEDATLRRRVDVQKAIEARRTQGYRGGPTIQALQAELDHLDEVARRIGQRRASIEKSFGETQGALAAVQARKSQIGRWGSDPSATPKPWAQSPDKAPAIGTVSPGLTMMPGTKALTGPRSAGWMKAAAGEASKLSVAVQDAAAQADTLKTALGADLAGPANSAMAGYNAALQAGVDRALAIARAGAAELSKALSFSAAPTIQPRLAPGGATAVPSAGKAGKSARLSGGNVSIAQAHFHGVKDMAGVHRQALAHVDRKARGAHAGALHDVETA